MERLQHAVECASDSLNLFIDLLPFSICRLVICIRTVNLVFVSSSAEINHELGSLWNAHVSNSNVEKSGRVYFSVSVGHWMVCADSDVDYRLHSAIGPGHMC